MPRKKHYFLTPTARRHLREAKAWSLARWGETLTKDYFVALDKAANDLAKHHQAHGSREELSAGTGLQIFPVREHYLVYEPIGIGQIVIVAVFRQTRDFPNILSKHRHAYRRELDALRHNFAKEKKQRDV